MPEKKESDIPLPIVAVVFVAFIVLLYYLYYGGLSPLPSNSNQTGTNMSGNIQAFQASLLGSDEMGIMMNVTGLDTNRSRYVYACGAGLAGSWGKLGKNVSNLHIYVIEGDNCTSSSPVVAEGSLSNATESRTSSECAAESAGMVSFDIRYGPGYSIFTDRTAYIFVDENFDQECSFRTSGSSQPVITSD